MAGIKEELVGLALELGNRDSPPGSEAGIPALTYGPGAASVGSGVFYITKEDLVKAARVYALTALHLCSQERP